MEGKREIKGIKSKLTKETIDDVITILWNAFAEILIKTGMATELEEGEEDG